MIKIQTAKGAFDSRELGRVLVHKHVICMTIAALVKRGYVDRLALSHDCFCWSDFFPNEAARAEYFPEHSYLMSRRPLFPLFWKRGSHRIRSIRC